MKRQFALLLVAIQFLTRLPVPSPAGFEASWLAQSVRYFPFVGALVGIANVCVWWLASQMFPQNIAFALTLAASLLITGAFHEDGFADVCDGFGGGQSRADILRIMKDSRIGAYGAIGVFSILGTKWATLSAIDISAIPITMIIGHALSRWCAIGLMWRLPYVREDADAKSKSVANHLTLSDWLSSALMGAVAIAVVFAFVPVVTSKTIAALIAASATAIAIALLAGIYFRDRIGGYTGDCLGAAQQLAEVTFLLTALAMLNRAAGSV